MNLNLRNTSKNSIVYPLQSYSYLRYQTTTIIIAVNISNNSTTGTATATALNESESSVLSFPPTSLFIRKKVRNKLRLPYKLHIANSKYMQP